MKFNQYTWNLYKKSPEGQKTIKEFEAIDGYSLLQKYTPYYAKITPEGLYNDWLETIHCYGVSDCEVPTSLDEAKDLYEALITLGIMENGKAWISHNDFKNMLGFIQPISYLLSSFAPKFFFPYLFICRIFDLNKVADAFDIEIPIAPKKADYRARCLYYWQLCEVFYKFRIENNLTPTELCAFLYDFAPNSITKQEASIPEPTQAWFIGGYTERRERGLNFTFWQANLDTKKGDILVHYEKSPVSAITCLWTAQTDGVIDPFFHYYSNTYIGNKIEVPYITLKELQANKYFSKHPLIRRKFQGVNGWSMSSEDYIELLRIIKVKGFDADNLPRLYAPTISKNVSIAIERDVEIQLLEPLLNSMGWHENKDFIRQLPIHAGRGHRIFPDYALHYSDKPDYEHAKILIEAKFYMKNNQEIEEAFKQARSYANILESSVIILCDKQCIIVYEKKESFDRDRYKKYYWEELENPDLFNELKSKLKY